MRVELLGSKLYVGDRHGSDDSPSSHCEMCLLDVAAKMRITLQSCPVCRRAVRPLV